MIRLEGICRSFSLGDQVVHALRSVDEHITPGEHVAIMGPSGSGKSTLLNLIGCLDSPSSGRYVLAGRDVGALDESELTEVRRHQIGFIFQSFHLVPRLTAQQNVELPMVFAGLPRKERIERAAKALAAVGMTPRAHHSPEKLSGGERQRVAVARATVIEPRVLLADEPTGNLDSQSGNKVLDQLDLLNDNGLTLVVVTHDPRVAQRADRVIVLVDGTIVERVPGRDIHHVLELLAEPMPPSSGTR